TVQGAVAGFPIPAITFTLNGSAVATNSTPDPDSTVTARSIDSAPLIGGSYIYNATVDSNGDYIGATSADEPLTVNPSLNRTQGYWKNHGTNSPGGQENAWPVSSISIGGGVFTEEAALAGLELSCRRTRSSTLFPHPVAAAP